MPRARLLLLLLLLSCTVHAQSSGPGYDPLRARHPALLRQDVLHRQYESSQPAGKTTGLKKRLIAVCNRMLVGTYTDTSHFYYSGNRGSRLYAPEEYDQTYTPYGDDGRLKISCDSGFQWYRTGATSPWISLKQLAYRYNSGNQDTFYREASSGQVYQLTFGYNAAGLVSRINYFDTLSSGNGAFLLKNVTLLSYNAQNKIVLDSSFYAGTSLPAARNKYQYDGAGNLITADYSIWNGSSWQNSERLSFTYTAANQEATSLDQQYVNNQWVNYSRDTSSYAGANPLPAFNEYFYWDSTHWVPDYRLIYHFGPNGNYDTLHYAGWNTTLSAFEPGIKRFYQYDADGNLIYAQNNSFNGSSFSQAELTSNYYYETYNDATGVDHTPVAGTPIRVFPNPVTGSAGCRVDLSAFQAGASFRIRLINTRGQVMLEQGCNGGRMVPVPMQDVPAGTYFIQVQDSSGSLLHSGRLLKL